MGAELYHALQQWIEDRRYHRKVNIIMEAGREIVYIEQGNRATYIENVSELEEYTKKWSLLQ